MVKKLNFLLISKLPRLLLFKVLFFVLILAGLYFWDFSLTASAIFIISVFWLYFSQLPERRHFRFSFIILMLTAFFVLHFSVWGILIFFPLFYLLLGLGAFVFKNSAAVYLFLNTCLFLIIFLFFFGLGRPEYFLLVNLLLFLIIFFLLRECFKNSLFPIHNSQFIALVIAFLSLELFWAINLLPLGFVNSAILLTLFIFLTRDFVLAYFSGRLNRQFLVSHFLIFSILAVLIFVFSKWSI